MEEAATALAGRTLERVAQLDSHRFLLRFAEPPHPRAQIVIHPLISTFHLVRGVRASAAPTELAAALTSELTGRALTRLSRDQGERLVRLQFGPDRAIVVELMGKASNLILIDGDQTILRYARSHQGEFRQPVEGQRYAPPRRVGGLPSQQSGLPLIDETAFRRIVGAAELRRPRDGTLDASPQRGAGLDGRLLAEMPGLSPVVAREIAWRAGAGEDPWLVFADLASRLSGGGRAPVLYSPAAPDDLPESLPVTPRVLFAFVLPLAHATGLVATEMPSASQAEEAAAKCLLRHLAFHGMKHSLSALLRHERRRLEALDRVLEDELASAEKSAVEDRRRGELLLAGMSRARRDGAVVRVADPYDPEEKSVSIPIDPRLDLAANAQRYFKSARRSERTREMVPRRLEVVRARLVSVTQADASLESAGSREALETVESELQETGVLRAFRKRARPEVGARPEYVQVREFRTRDGFTVLVGRSGAENDHLTFRVAAPHDLWLHAAGYPGAHVVVRNPRRLGSLPDSTVREAAGVAAWFSKGRDEKEIDVHVAWRRHVRKARGMSAGMVMMKRHRTVRAAPALPQTSPV